MLNLVRLIVVTGQLTVSGQAIRDKRYTIRRDKERVPAEWLKAEKGGKRG